MSSRSSQILQVISYGESLTFHCSKEVLHDRVGVVAKRDLDWALETVDVSVVASSLVCLVLLHKRNQFFGGPALDLEVVVVRC